MLTIPISKPSPHSVSAVIILFHSITSKTYCHCYLITLSTEHLLQFIDLFVNYFYTAFTESIL